MVESGPDQQGGMWKPLQRTPEVPPFAPLLVTALAFDARHLT